MAENKDKNIKKSCDCMVSQPQPGHYVENCKCEFEADFNEGKENQNLVKKKCKKCHCCVPVECCPTSQPMQQQQQQLPQSGMQISPTGCVEDPYAALANCVQKCMDEKGQLAQTCGIKCPECPPPPPPAADKPAKDKGDKGKAAKGKAKGKKKGGK